MANNLSLQDAFSLFIHHLRAGSVEEQWILIYERALKEPFKRLIAKELPADTLSQDIDTLPISHIPRKVIEDCMRLDLNLTYRIGRRFFKFLIHAGMLDPGFLPARKTVLIRAIEQAPDELSDKMNLRQACCAFVGHLWEKKTLLYDGIRTQYTNLCSFAKWIGTQKNLGAVSRNDIQDYLQYLQQERGYSAVSRASALSGLRAFFAYFTASGVLKTNPTVTLRVKKPKKRPQGAFSEEELTLIFLTSYLNYRQYEQVVPGSHKQACSRWLAARDWAIVSLLITTGIRYKEIAHIHTDSIDFKQRFIKITGKGDTQHTVRERIIPVTEPIALSALETYLRLRPESVFPHLFLSPRLEPLQHVGFSGAIKKTARQAQIPKKINITSLRKSFSSLCAHKGVDPLILKQVMGQRSLATTMKYYLSIREQQLREEWENNNPLQHFSKKEWQQWIL